MFLKEHRGFVAQAARIVAGKSGNVNTCMAEVSKFLRGHMRRSPEYTSKVEAAVKSIERGWNGKH